MFVVLEFIISVGTIYHFMSGFSASHIYPNKFFKPFYGEKNTRKYMEFKTS